MEQQRLEPRSVGPRTCDLTLLRVLLVSKGSVRSLHLSKGPLCIPLPALCSTCAPYDGQHLPTPHFEAQVLDAQLTGVLVRGPRHLKLSQLLKPRHLGGRVHLWGYIRRFLRELFGSLQEPSAC